MKIRKDISHGPSGAAAAVELNQYPIRIIYLKAANLTLGIGPDIRRSRQLNPLGSQLSH